MHQKLQQRVDGLNAMRARVKSASVELFAMIGREQPPQPLRYQVRTVGPSAYHIVDRISGKTRGFRFTHNAAVELAKSLEAKAATTAFVPGGSK